MNIELDVVDKILARHGTRKGLIAMFCMWLMSQLPVPESIDVKIQIAIIAAKLTFMCLVAIIAILCLWSLDKRKPSPEAPDVEIPDEN